jgi:hypothetical protein
MRTIVRAQVSKISKKNSYNKKEDGTPAIETEIEFNIPYENDATKVGYDFARLSGGTQFKLVTINEDAASQFDLGSFYDFNITKSES